MPQNLLHTYTYGYIATITPDFYGTGFPPIIGHRVVAAAIGRLVYSPTEVKFEVISNCIPDLAYEEKLVRWCSSRLVGDGSGQVVTFYGETFLFPVLLYRSLHYGTTFTTPTDTVDLANWTALNNGVKKLSVSDCAELIGLPKRYNIDISARFHEKDHDTLVGSVETDLMITALVHLRFLLVAGVLDRSRFRAVGRAIVETSTRRTELAKEYISSANVKTFLFAQSKNGDPSKSSEQQP